MCLFLNFGQQHLSTSFSRMADHSYNLAKSHGNLSKGGYRITGNGKVLVDKISDKGQKDKICKQRRENIGGLFRSYPSKSLWTYFYCIYSDSY